MGKKNFYFLLMTALLFACGREKPRGTETGTASAAAGFTTFQEDLDFLEKHTEVIILQEPSGRGRIAIAPGLQGRVMTSTAGGGEGRSYGWINRALFESGDTLEHINAFGGEERFWLGPEGGQFSIFFEKGAAFTLDDWQTPRLIDLEPFDLVDQAAGKATFSKRASLTNYSGFTFHFDIERVIEVLPSGQALSGLGLPEDASVDLVAYQTTNKLTNTGAEAWKKETGLLSIWLLGMYNPSPVTTVIIPYNREDETDLGPVVNDTYFGKVPADRLKTGDGVLFFTGDGQYRSKIGLSPSRARDILGAYDADNRILTIVRYNKPEGETDYVNSLWELQDEPYRGDVINSYNDGPPEPGAKPMGPFFELESSSPALALEPGESGTHIQQTFHFEGEAEALEKIARQLLGVSLLDL